MTYPLSVIQGDLNPFCLLLLDGVEDPHNLGAILRTSWLMGIKGVVIPQHRAARLTSAAMKVASGGAEHVPLLEVPSFTPFIQEWKQNNFWFFGLDHKASKTIYQVNFPSRVVFAFGGEDRGLRSTTVSACDEVIRIPQQSFEASYNVSVSVGIVLGEYIRQVNSFDKTR